MNPNINLNIGDFIIVKNLLMKNFYEKILFKKACWDDKCKCFNVNLNDINKGFKEYGYKEYCFGGFYIFAKKELTPKEIEQYKKESQEIINKGVDEITKEVNKNILNKILKN